MAALGLTNLIFALDFGFATWAWFVSFGAVGAMATAVALQCAIFRTIVAFAWRNQQRGAS